MTLKATAPIGARCSASLMPARRGSQVKLGTQHFTNGDAVWRYSLPRQAPARDWKATVACSTGGSASRRFEVGSPSVAPAQIEVVKSAFVSQALSSVFLTCGVELKNVSHSDARNLTVNVSFVDTHGSAVATSTTYLGLIPAGQVFYMSCIEQLNVNLTVALMQVTVKVGESTTPTAALLPTVSNLVLTPDQYDISQTLTGSLSNPYNTPLSRDATIYALYYDANGNFVGGSYENTGAAVEPGATVSFSFADLDPSVTTTQVSVDPCGSSRLEQLGRPQTSSVRAS